MLKSNIALERATIRKGQFAMEARAPKVGEDGLLILQGPAIFVDTPSLNLRHYVQQSIDECIEENRTKIENKSWLGELDHPMTNDIDRVATVLLDRVSHRIDDIWFDEPSRAYHIRVTVLDTPNGRILKSISDAGSPLFVSLRSLLDPTKTFNRKDGVQESYMMALITIDFVSEPGFGDAMLKPITIADESKMLAVAENFGLIQKPKNTTVSKQVQKGDVKRFARFVVSAHEDNDKTIVMLKKPGNLIVNEHLEKFKHRIKTNSKFIRIEANNLKHSKQIFEGLEFN